jgi:hypothetical protein
VTAGIFGNIWLIQRSKDIMGRRGRASWVSVGILALVACAGCARFKQADEKVHGRQPDSALEAPGMLQAASDSESGSLSSSRSLDGAGPRSFDPFSSRSSPPLNRLQGSSAPEWPGNGYLQGFPNLRPSDRDIQQMLRDKMPAAGK